jgi:two-component system, LuxR family, sensor kinase FixL
VIATRIACLVPNFTSGMNVNFREIRSLDFVTFGSSGPLAVPIGDPNPWMTLVAINACLLAAYIAKALVEVHRRGDIDEWRNAIVTCGSLLFFVVVASAWNRAIVFGTLHAPMLMSPAFVGVMLAMSYDVGSSKLRATKLAHKLSIQRDQLVHLSRVTLLTEISGSLAHELTQPVTAILSNAQAGLHYLGHSPANVGEVREGLLQIVENAKRAGEVIRRLRTMMRNDPSSDRRPLDLNDVVSDTMQLVRIDLVNRNIELVLELAPDLPRVSGDRVQLQQVLLNLVLNGIQAMPETGGSLRIQTRSAGVAGVEVLVADDGCGISEGDLERIFSPFVTDKSDGLGLGLSICASIVQGHDGAIWAQNNPGRGATVTFRLPAHENAIRPPSSRPHDPEQRAG